MRLFKFVRLGENTMHNIASGWMRFTPVDQLNDPSELLPVFSDAAIAQSLADLRRGGHSPEQLRWLHCQEAVLDRLAPGTRRLPAPKTPADADRIIRSSIYDDFVFMRKRHAEAVSMIKERVGISSLTSRFDSLPMWAHYADNAQGAVVEYKELDAVFPGDQTGSLNAVKPVRYTEEPIGMTFDPATQDDLFFNKFADWSYEREFRVVRALGECNANRAEGLFLFQLPETCVVRVIFGWKCQPVVVANMRSIAEQANSRIRFSSATISNGRVVAPKRDTN